MKGLLTLAVVVSTLGGCAVVPLAPRVAYVAPGRIAARKALALSHSIGTHGRNA